jgi:hypothetical protein
MVVSGTVSADVNGVAATPANVVVNARTNYPGPDFPPPFSMGQGPYGKPKTVGGQGPFTLKDPPFIESDLGDTKSWVQFKSPLANYFHKAGPGPNEGLYYSDPDQNPLSVRVDVAINRDAMNTASIWASWQSPTRVLPGPKPNVPWCARSEVAGPIISMVQQHEGELPHPNSHYNTLQPTYNQILSDGVEKLVLTQPPQKTDFVTMITDAEYKAPIESAKITHNQQLNPIQLTCQFFYIGYLLIPGP